MGLKEAYSLYTPWVRFRYAAIYARWLKDFRRIKKRVQAENQLYSAGKKAAGHKGLSETIYNWRDKIKAMFHFLVFGDLRVIVIK